MSYLHRIIPSLVFPRRLLNGMSGLSNGLITVLLIVTVKVLGYSCKSGPSFICIKNSDYGYAKEIYFKARIAHRFDVSCIYNSVGLCIAKY